MAIETATLGGGCFWCVEAVYDQLQGVTDVVSGYMGGALPNPSYEMVCTGATGHAEVVQVKFDNSIVSYDDILRVFFTVHDPTQLNRQGNDVGTQYRSVIFTHSDAQREAAGRIIREVAEQGLYPGRIVTEVTPASAFYPAEDYHQEYFARNPQQGYCRVVVAPKVAKFRKQYMDRLKA
jgi:peptide-methionine (S)-S-oxide reductase